MFTKHKNDYLKTSIVLDNQGRRRSNECFHQKCPPYVDHKDDRGPDGTDGTYGRILCGLNTLDMVHSQMLYGWDGVWDPPMGLTFNVDTHLQLFPAISGWYEDENVRSFLSFVIFRGLSDTFCLSYVSRCVFSQP